MSLTLLVAMTKFKKPDDFLEQCILKTSKLGSNQKFGMNLNVKNLPEFKKGRYTSITFVNEKTGKKILNFSITRTDKLIGKKSQFTDPHVKLGLETLFRLNTFDWSNAVKMVGATKQKHSEERGSTSHNLLIPEEAVRHWNPQEKKNRDNTWQIEVKINETNFRELKNIQSAHNAIRFYLSTINFLSKFSLTDKHMERLFRLDRIKGFQNLSTLDKIMEYSKLKGYDKLFKTLANAKNVANAEAIITSYFHLPREVFEEYHTSLKYICESKITEFARSEFDALLKNPEHRKKIEAILKEHTLQNHNKTLLESEIGKTIKFDLRKADKGRRINPDKIPTEKHTVNQFRNFQTKKESEMTLGDMLGQTKSEKQQILETRSTMQGKNVSAPQRKNVSTPQRKDVSPPSRPKKQKRTPVNVQPDLIRARLIHGGQIKPSNPSERELAEKIIKAAEQKQKNQHKPKKNKPRRFRG